MNKRYPSADQPLNYEHVLFNHLECMSFFVAQGTADLKQMIEIFEQLVIPKTNDNERELFALFKLIIQDIKDLIHDYYDYKKAEISRKSDKPEKDIEEIENELEEVFKDLEDVYYKLLLRFLVVLSQRHQERGIVRYKPDELFRDLKIELRSILPFSEDIVDGVIMRYVASEDSTGDQRETTVETE